MRSTDFADYTDSKSDRLFLICVIRGICGSFHAHLAPHFARLRRASVVLGPAEDGGYYLIGLNRPMPWLFRGIAWSSSQVLEQTRRILERERLTAGFLPVERDLDTIEDLRAVEATAESLNHFPQTQSFLLRRRRGAPLGQV